MIDGVSKPRIRRSSEIFGRRNEAPPPAPPEDAQRWSFRSALALKAARLVGLPTLRIEVLSIVGEELIELRDFEHLLAATPDDAYNALVCTRFASELGRERVHQIAPSEDSERHATSREWRGTIAVAETMTHERLAELMKEGAAFVVEPFNRSSAERPVDESWPTAVIGGNGAFTMFGPDQEVHPAAGDIVVRMYRAALAPVLKPASKRWTLRRDVRPARSAGPRAA